MPRGLYKRAMHRADSPTARDDSENGAGSAPPARESEKAGAKSAGAPPLIGQRTIHTDRMVSRRARSRSKTKKIRNLKLLVAALILGIVATSTGWMLAWAKMKLVQEESRALDADLRKQEVETEKLRERLSQRETELFNLVENRIPGLEEIVFNRLIDINDRYVVNLTFSQAGTEEERVLEYHLMLQNDGAGIVLPRVTLYLFDEFGLQVGVHRLTKHHATSPADLEELQPGETRSYHAPVTVERDAKPKYYLLHIE